MTTVSWNLPLRHRPPRGPIHPAKPVVVVVVVVKPVVVVEDEEPAAAVVEVSVMEASRLPPREWTRTWRSGSTGISSAVFGIDSTRL
jgi:hypothetical protein